MRTTQYAIARVWAMRLCMLSGLCLLSMLAPPAQADPYTITRTSSFTYYGASDGAKNGLLASETVEPDQPQLCVSTVHDYDDFGHKKSATTSNCAGASGRALFTTRSATSSYPTQPGTQAITVNGASTTVTVAAGLFASSSSNALTQSETRTHDPRFGAALTLTGPNQLTTRWELDDFGRTVKVVSADNTSTINAYCVLANSGLDISANSANCPTPAGGEPPADAISFVHTEPRDQNNAKMGAFVRVYSDRLGRQIRSVTESFDGAAQPQARRGVLIVKDTVYNTYGAKVLETQPYFLASGSSTTAGNNDVGLSLTEYDALGRPSAVYVADPNGSQASITFGSYGSRRASKQTVAYSGLSSTTTNDEQQTRTEEKNANGELLRVTDASGAQIAYQRDALGNLIATRDALQNTITTTYDTRGRKTQMVDPDAGTSNYEYDALGQLVRQQSAKQLAANTDTTLTYDVLGRMTSRTEPEYTSTWTYDKYADGSPCNKGTGKLCESSTTHGVSRKLIYDDLGRPVSSRSIILSGGPSLASALAYDATTGRVTIQTYPTGVQVGYSYTASGFVEQLILRTAATISPLPGTAGGMAGASASLAANSVLWSAQTVSAWGKTEQQAFGSGAASITGKAIYEAATGRTVGLSAGSGSSTTVLNQEYVWDSLNNLTARLDHNGDGGTGAVSEEFQYGDAVSRLTWYRVSAPAIAGLSRTVSLQYNALGMLLYKSDVGNYAYGAQGASAVRPHTLQSVSGATSTSYQYDANGNLINASAGKYRSISYTSFNLPDSQNGIGGPDGSPRYTWQYDENHARVKETHVDASGTRTTWYLHPDNSGGLGFEREVAAGGAASNRHYLSVAGQTIGVLVTTSALPDLGNTQTAPTVLSTVVAVKLEYWHKDHLGSLVATTDHTGTLTQRYAYDPFGKRRYTNGSYDAFGSLVIDWSNTQNWGTDRGFTGHEQLDDIGLVHMNGRIFDPTLGVFLQADPMIQDPGDLQNFNRYGYCLNNPLTCTDPSGFWSLRSILDPRPRWFMDPVAYYTARAVARTQVGYQIGSIAISVLSTYCTAAAAACNAAGQMAWASLAGYSSEQVIQTGIFAFISAGANDVIGDTFKSQLGNTLAHGAWGCAEASMQGGSCGAGLRGGLAGAAVSNYAPGDMSTGYGNFADRVANTMMHAAIGGVAATMGGGHFADGARSAAFAYLFNCLAHECWKQGALGAVKAVGGGLTVATGVAICTSVAGCALGAPMAAFGASDAWQGGGMVVDAVHGISGEGFNLIKTGFQLAMPEWGGAVYEGISLGLNVGAIGAKVPLIVGASDGIGRVKSMFDVTVSRWDNARVVLGNVASQSVNRLMLTGSAIGKAFGVEREVNAVGTGP